MPAKPRKIVSAQGGAAMVNYCAVANLLRIVNLLQRSIFSMAGSFGGVGLTVYILSQQESPPDEVHPK